MTSTICRCKKQDFVCRQVNDRLTFRGEFLWVCATCCLPHKLVWEGYVRKCEGCFNPRCLPWETYCQACHQIEFPDKVYHGLRNAAKRATKKLTWPLPKTDIATVLANKAMQHKGSSPYGGENIIQDSGKLSDTI